MTQPLPSGPYLVGRHRCPCGCGLPIGNDRWACPTGWSRLPFEHRDAIMRTRRLSSIHPERRAVLEAALAWYRNNPRPGAS